MGFPSTVSLQFTRADGLTAGSTPSFPTIVAILSRLPGINLLVPLVYPSN